MASLILAYIIFSFFRALIVFKIVLGGATGMHNKMTEVVLRANVLFFDSHPIGRILTRFSKDMIVLDQLIPPFALLLIFGVFRTITVAITVGVVNPWLFIPIAISLTLMFYVMRIGSASMVESQRMDAIFRGPVHSTFAMVVNGLVSLRANKKVDFFRINFIYNLEKGANATFCYNVANRWLGVRLDLTCLLFSSAAVIFAISFKGQIESAQLSFTLQIITDVIVFFSFSLRLFAEFENFMTSSQRIYEYTELDQEDELEKAEDHKLESRGWPMNGKIEFDDSVMSYRPELDPSIKNLTCKVQAGMKVGIVGRTGAGKSSILQALFRLSELTSGKIKIDGSDLKEVGLHTLRKNIAFIP